MHARNVRELKQIREEELELLHERGQEYKVLRKGKGKFMVSQIGPAMSQALHIESGRLPFLHKQSIFHQQESSENERYRLLLMHQWLKNTREEA
jgi:hypothetical protein